MPGGVTAYTVLGVAETATGEEIARAWKKKRLHFGSMRAARRGADLAPEDEKRERMVNHAYDKLGKPSARNGFPPRRRTYDADLKAARERIAREAADREAAAARAAADAKAAAERKAAADAKAAADRQAKADADKQAADAKTAADRQAKADADKLAAEAKAANDAKSAADAATAKPQPQPTWPPAPPPRAPQQPNQGYYTIRIPRLSQNRRLQGGVAAMLLGAVVLTGQFQQFLAPPVATPVTAETETVAKVKKPVRVAKRTTRRTGGRTRRTRDADRKAVADANRQQLRRLNDGNATHSGVAHVQNRQHYDILDPRSIGLDATNPELANSHPSKGKGSPRPSIRSHDVYQPLVINLDGK